MVSSTSTPASNKMTPREMPSTAAKQRSLLSFFTKMGVSTPKKSEEEKEYKNATVLSVAVQDDDEVELPKPIASKSSLNSRHPPVAGLFSSDALSPDESDTPIDAFRSRGRLHRRADMERSSPPPPSSPTAGRGSKRVTYAESSDSEADIPMTRGQATKRRKHSVVESEDEYNEDGADIDGKNHPATSFETFELISPQQWTWTTSLSLMMRMMRTHQ